ncbi:hypothetical protein [Nocardia altamirensis]|uniref:hypothetical protein n=1 Tax=Nocardia altamirensis TaxID=472158 RepID=UPI0008401C5D|nr:hypothetical protein [Nocardia altamirensis]
MEHAAAWVVAVLQVIEDEVEELAETGQGAVEQPITALDVYRVLRRVVDPPPSVDEVAAVLEFLASPLLGGVVKTEGGYLPGAEVGTVAQRLLDLAEPLVGAHQQQAGTAAYYRHIPIGDDNDRY